MPSSSWPVSAPSLALWRRPLQKSRGTATQNFVPPCPRPWLTWACLRRSNWNCCERPWGMWPRASATRRCGEPRALGPAAAPLLPDLLRILDGLDREEWSWSCVVRALEAMGSAAARLWRPCGRSNETLPPASAPCRPNSNSGDQLHKPTRSLSRGIGYNKDGAGCRLALRAWRVSWFHLGNIRQKEALWEPTSYRPMQRPASTSWRSTPSAAWPWTPSRRPTPAIPARRWPWPRWLTVSGSASCASTPAIPSGPTATASSSPSAMLPCCSTPCST